MDFLPVTVTNPAGTLSPLVVDSPHSGRDYPADFAFTCPLPMLRQAEDFLVDQLAAVAPQAGAALVAANFPRSYIDVNRAEDDIDPAVLAENWPTPLRLTERTALGLGLIRRLCMTGVPVYAAPLPVAAVKKRIENYYRPYHAALCQALDVRVRKFGFSFLLNMHSMPGRSLDDIHAARADFVLGDRLGASCDPSWTRKVAGLLQDMGYSTALNEPYKGMEIVRRYGQPAAMQHALQIEINRRLYMDERKLEIHEGFAELQKNLGAFFIALAGELSTDLAEPLAAE